MKIGILTQPLHSNFGGLMQAWALQHKLVEMGHEAIIINRVHNPNNHRKPLWYRILSKVKNEVYIALDKRKRYLKVSAKLKDYSEQNVKEFRKNRYEGISPDIMTDDELIDYVSKQKFDAYIVGSDQVWRPCYSPNLMTYFLDFARENDNVKKIAYAASFGVDNWELSTKETKEAAQLAPLFDLITVRESSGVKLVKEYFHCEATQVLDPTMLFDKKDYINLVENSTCQLHNSDGELFCYILDTNNALDDALENCSSALGVKPYFCNYKIPLRRIEEGQKFEDCIVPPVEQWLKSFNDAKMVVTDSFHGCVFSIIFNKPFWVVTNVGRGSARFSSLLKQFNLEDRIVSNPSQVDWLKPIDWDIINNLRTQLAEKSKELLINNLY